MTSTDMQVLEEFPIICIPAKIVKFEFGKKEPSDLKCSIFYHTLYSVSLNVYVIHTTCRHLISTSIQCTGN